MKPERLSLDPNSPDAELKWRHWHKTFSNFLSKLNEVTEDDKYAILINYLSAEVYTYVSSTSDFKNAISTLQKLYEKPKNEIFARHLLATKKQDPGERIDHFYQTLLQLSKDCEFKDVTSTEHCNGYIRDSFIAGLSSSYIRQRLLENNSLTLQEALDKARSLETAQTQAAVYTNSTIVSSSETATCAHTESIQLPTDYEHQSSNTCAVSKSSSTNFVCYFCGGKERHKRSSCPARNATCKNCSRKGHFAKVCLSANQDKLSAATSKLCGTNSKNSSRSNIDRAMVKVKINNVNLQALVDTGSSDSFIGQDIAKCLGISIRPSKGKISLASTETTSIVGECYVTLCCHDAQYHDFKLTVLPHLCADIILGHDFLNEHSSLEMNFDGNKPALKVCNLAVANVPPPDLFANLKRDCNPVAIKSRRYSPAHKEFIHTEVQNLLSEGIIEPSKSPWRAQVLVAGSGHSKKRLVIDYSQTINRFTYLDAYPLPNITDMIEEIAKYSIFTCLDLKSAYHQVPIKLKERPYTAFEADGNLYQFTRIPFGVTNGVAAFQRTVDNIIRSEKLAGTFAYVDNITICGSTQHEHDMNLRKFREAAVKYNLTFNESKSIISKQSISMLGYLIDNHSIKPDPERLEPLLQLATPTTASMLQRALGLFAYYSNWIPKYSDKIRPLTQSSTFPLSETACKAFEAIKREISEAIVVAIDDSIPFVVETDASDHCIAATLNQAGRPVAFFSRTLSKQEQRHPTIEKEAYAIVEAIRKWRHFLIGRHFRLITDQRSVSFMFDKHKLGKIKNEKIARWRVELSPFSYDIEYRAGKQNVVADAFTRSPTCNATHTVDNLKEIHDSLCHPGVRRMAHYVRTKNLPYSMEEIKRMTAQCPECAAVKPRFHQPPNVHLIKATQPFERISIDFKGPLPSNSHNKYILTVIDEYSRFPFAFPTKNLHSNTVIQCLHSLFTIFGTPAFVHSDRGQSFMSRELQQYLLQNGIATSRTSPYNPTGNGQVERYNGIVWKTVLLALKSKGLDVKLWETVLPDALHSIRSLLSTATNTTPHERMFKHSRRSMFGPSIPTWLTDANSKVLLRRHVRASKYEPLVDEVELLEANHQYAHIRYPDGRESTVSTRHLAPAGDVIERDSSSVSVHDHMAELESPSSPRHNDNSDPKQDTPYDSPNTPLPDSGITQAVPSPEITENFGDSTPTLRRSERIRRPPIRYGYE